MLCGEHEKRAEDIVGYGAALMLQVAEHDWALVNEKICVLTHPLHVTIAYLETPDEAAAKRACQLGTAFLEERAGLGMYTFCVETCQAMFDIVSAFEPTQSTIAGLKNLNQELEQHLAAAGFALNAHTTNHHYLPHMTVRRRIFEPAEFQNINEAIAGLKSSNLQNKFCLQLDTVTVLLKPKTHKTGV